MDKVYGWNRLYSHIIWQTACHMESVSFREYECMFGIDGIESIVSMDRVYAWNGLYREYGIDCIDSME